MNIFSNLLPAPLLRKRRGGLIKTSEEIAIMRQSSRIVATVLKEVAELVEPGMTTADLDAFAEKRIRGFGATPSFKGYHGFPASLCTSVNHEVVHGIPSRKKVLRKGDVLKVDTGACFKAFMAIPVLRSSSVEKLQPKRPISLKWRNRPFTDRLNRCGPEPIC